MIENFREAGNEWLATTIKNGGYAPLADIIDIESADFFLHGAPVIVSAFAEKNRPVSTYDCAIALAYFDLAAISLGLGCFWNGFFQGAATNFPPIKDAIALPEDYQIFGSLVVGYPKYKYNRIPMRNQARITWR
jgi:nitroreductase